MCGREVPVQVQLQGQDEMYVRQSCMYVHALMRGCKTADSM